MDLIRSAGITIDAGYIVYSLIMLLVQSGITTWVVHKLSSSSIYRSQMTFKSILLYIFESYVWAAFILRFVMLFISASAMAILWLRGTPSDQIAQTLTGSYLWQHVSFQLLLFFLIATVVQIRKIRVPEQINKRKFMFIIVAINVGIMLAWHGYYLFI